MTECQGCGAWNDTRRTVCVLCGTPLAATDEWEAGEELPPLPPLPDGGLAASMPAWLREAPVEVGSRESGVGSWMAGTEPSSTPQLLEPSLSVAPPTSDLRLPTPVADPRTFLSDDDFPLWLRELAARLPERPARQPVGEAPAPVMPWADWPVAAPKAAVEAEPAPPVVGDGMPSPATLPGEAEVSPTALEGLPPAAVVAARALEERRRSPWETLLLVILFLGVVIAAFWALVSNGVFSPGL